LGSSLGGFSGEDGRAFRVGGTIEAFIAKVDRGELGGSVGRSYSAILCDVTFTIVILRGPVCCSARSSFTDCSFIVAIGILISGKGRGFIGLAFGNSFGFGISFHGFEEFFRGFGTADNLETFMAPATTTLSA